MARHAIRTGPGGDRAAPRGRRTQPAEAHRRGARFLAARNAVSRSRNGGRAVLGITRAWRTADPADDPRVAILAAPSRGRQPAGNGRAGRACRVRPGRDSSDVAADRWRGEGLVPRSAPVARPDRRRRGPPGRRPPDEPLIIAEGIENAASGDARDRLARLGRVSAPAASSG